jgi:hypothetical protein
MGVCQMLALVVAARTYQHLPDRGSRRRSRWVMASLITACGPVGITFGFHTTEWASQATWELVYPPTFLAMLAIPASIAMASGKNSDSTSARPALRTLLALSIALLVFSIVSNPNRTVAEILTQGSGWVNLLLIGAIAATLQSRQRLQTALDRRFFREAYEQEQVLAHLIDEVRQRDSLAEIARLVSTRIDSVLHPTSSHVLYRAQERSEKFEGHSSSASLVTHELSQQRATSYLRCTLTTRKELAVQLRGCLSRVPFSQCWRIEHRQHTLLRLIEDTEVIRDFPTDFKDTLPDIAALLDQRPGIMMWAVDVPAFMIQAPFSRRCSGKPSDAWVAPGTAIVTSCAET